LLDRFMLETVSVMPDVLATTMGEDLKSGS